MKKLKTKNKKLLYKPNTRKVKEYPRKEFIENLFTLIMTEQMNEYLNKINKINTE